MGSATTHHRARETALLTGCVRTALRAPSVLNTQPWRWRIGGAQVDLYADPDRHLTCADPDGTDLLLSCGAAVHHLVVALAAAGRGAEVTRFPDVDDRYHLARIRVTAERPDDATVGLAAAIEVRHTDRRRFSATAVAPDVLAHLVAVAAEHDTAVIPAHGTQRAFLLDVLRTAAAEQRRSPGYAAERDRWAGRYRGAHDGIDVAALAASQEAMHDVPMRPMPHATLAQPPFDHEDGSALLVVAAAETDSAILRAGEAVSAVLLTATAQGLATTPLSQATEVRRTRDAIGMRMLDPGLVPVLILRVGYVVAGAAPLPRSARRDLSAVLAAPRAVRR